jgi:hypothetical protein
MKTCYYYLIVEPLLNRYRDDADTKPTSTGLIKIKSKKYKISFFMDGTRLSMIRIDIPDLPGKTIPEQDLESVHILREHIVSVLRLNYDSEASLFSHAMRVFREKGLGPILSIKLKQILKITPNLAPYIENIRDTLVVSFPLRVQTKLLSDAQDERLPLQYRYLSLYKLLEMECKREGRWKQEFERLVNRSEAEFRNLGIKMKPVNYIHYLRDRCAHIKTNREAYGVTQLSRKDMAEIRKFLPLMTSICTTSLNENHSDVDFSLVDEKTFRQEIEGRIKDEKRARRMKIYRKRK